MSPFVLNRRHHKLKVVFAGSILAIAGCQGATSPLEDVAETSTHVKFESGAFGVPANPRVMPFRKVAKSGGRAQVGKPYKVRGQWYYPKEEPGYSATGVASWYGPKFHGRLTANSETYDMNGLSAAHKTLPLPSYAMITNIDNGSRVMVRVNDRGPFSHNREIDVSSQVAELLHFKGSGTANVKVDYIGRAPLEGDDTRMLMASYQAGTEAGNTGSIVAAGTLRSGLPGVRVESGTDVVSSYAGAATRSAALRALAAFRSGSTKPVQVALGLVDHAVMNRVRAITKGHGKLAMDVLPGLEDVSASFTIEPGADAGALLRQLWLVGATDAFIVRD